MCRFCENKYFREFKKKFQVVGLIERSTQKYNILITANKADKRRMKNFLEIFFDKKNQYFYGKVERAYSDLKFIL